MKIPRFFKCFVFLLIFPAAVFARDITVTVEDEDLAMPLEGALITLRGGAQFYSNENGIARITLPDDKQAIITVNYPGYEPLRMTIPPAGTGGNSFKAALRLGGIMTSQELVIEASRPETSETKSGRSVAISERELTRTAEIGIIEDVMSSVKLLPGVGYSGMFSAMPSIRGGDPGDLMASLDGFYLERPYHWMGSISIFDPKMVSSARLSHGVFSARYGHTISGLLEVTSKSPSPTETELEAAIGSSAASLNLSVPFGGRGGILFMGKITYWDTFIWAMQGLSKVVDDENLDLINSITTSPYIRSAALSMNYRLTADMELKVNGFFGSDGIGMEVDTDYSRFIEDDITGVMSAKADYNNYQGFLIAALTASPVPKLAMRFTGGFGFIETITEDYVNNEITARYNDEFLDLFPGNIADNLRGKTYSAPNVGVTLDIENTIFNTQGRADFDIDLGHGFITAFGVQELYSIWKNYEDIDLFLEIPISSLLYSDDPKIKQIIMYMRMMNQWFPIMDIPNAALIQPKSFIGDVNNQGLTTSGYGLIEYASPDQRFGAELGLRIDHLYFKGKSFEAVTAPAFNPRLNLDFTILKNYGELDSLAATVGSGLFSSVNSLISFVDEETGLGDNDLKFNRSWTSVAGLKFDFFKKYTFNIEGYYKYVFDRAYIVADITTETIQPVFNFDGIGHVWGFDFQLQKLESRYWDGWISYTFTWAKYKDPNAGGAGLNMGNTDSEGNDWYFPSFHRYSNANIVLNIKPLNWFNIAVRFGFASGQPARKIISYTIYPYPVQVVDENFMPQLDENGEPIIIQKYDRKSVYEDTRTPWSLPLDVKLSFFFGNINGKSSLELYFAVENLLSLVYKPSRINTRYNEYTGKEDLSTGSGNFDLPIPMASFGLKWKY